MRLDSHRSVARWIKRRASHVVAASVLLALAGPAGALANPSSHPFAIEPGSFHITPSSTQAGAHADLVTTFNFEHEANAEENTYNDVSTTIVNLPVGFAGNSTAVPTCSDAQLIASGRLSGAEGQCPADTQVGQISFDLTLFAPIPELFTVPVYNMQPNTGVAATLGFKAVVLSQILPVSVRPQDTGITVTSPDIEALGEIHNITFTVWGLPADASHNPQRGRLCVAHFNGEEGEFCPNEGGEEVNIPVEPFLSNPTSCGPLTATMEADSWEHLESWSQASAEVGPITECERVPFAPSIEVQPTTRSAESPSGLNVSLLVPQTYEDPDTIAAANLKDSKVTLPAGVTINPSAGSGLGSCTPAQYEAETAESLPGEGCPPESKIGSIEIETPILNEKILGAVYIAKPYENPFNSLLALYIVAKIPDRGVIIKVAGKLEANPVTGQLTTTFENAPQQPFNRFTLKFRSGATAPLVSPPACGSYTTQAALTPWSEPLEAQLVSSSFETTEGVHEGACPTGGVPPFAPQVISGTQNNDAGSYSPFYLRIIREDGEQELTKFTTVLPPGLTGNLTGIPYCPEADIEAARSVTGTEEIEHPSCPAASEIGHTIVSAGVGTVLAQTPGKVYLAGPYHGSALSIVSITSAKVGPFDLGTVVIRFALRINPTTAQVEVDSNGSDPIPHIIDGIVVHVREVRVYMDREKFILNPTSCDPMSITDTIIGAGADFTNPADADPVTVSTPFQAADCQSLAFKPGFTVSTQAKTSRDEGASLTAKLTYPSAPLGTQSNIKSVKVELPKQLPSRLSTLQKACTAKVFDVNPAACPAASMIGHATAVTPILPEPLTGPAYFVSNGGAKFPELIVVLQGYGFTIDLHGETFISKAGITSSTFATVPDEPIGSFELTLPEGPDSALGATANLCKSKLIMPTYFSAQNGATQDENTKISVTGCPKAKKATKKHKKKSKGKQKGKSKKK